MRAISIAHGQRFGKLTFICELPRIADTTGRRRRAAKFLCDCGKTITADPVRVARGVPASCGCLRRTHGKTKTPEHRRWAAMMCRCYTRTSSNYDDYMGRGITVCDEWRGRTGFAQFLSDMGPMPFPDAQIERIDNDGPYCKSNCKWATIKEQSRNRRSTIKVSHNGITMCLKDWCKILGKNYSTVQVHVWRGRDPLRELGLITD